MTWKICDIHKIYGKVIAMGKREEEEPYRFFQKNGIISLIPLTCLEKRCECNNCTDSCDCACACHIPTDAWPTEKDYEEGE